MAELAATTNAAAAEARSTSGLAETPAEASNNAETEASNTADALAVVLEANLPTFVAGSTRIVGALRRCDKAWRDALGAHPATKRLPKHVFCGVTIFFVASREHQQTPFGYSLLDDAEPR